jgi:hypothetical protein
MNIKRKEFVRFINQLQTLKEAEEKFAAISREYGFEFMCVDFTSHESLIVDILKSACADNKRDSWIDYFIYELDFGRKYTEAHITDANGQSIALANADDLYSRLEEDEE